MPTMVKIEANPGFKPATPEEEAAFKTAKAKGAIELAAVVAYDNVRLSRGMYRVVPEKPQGDIQVKNQSLESMTAMDLMEMATKLGITIRKQKMKKEDLIFIIRERLGQIEVVDEDFVEEDPDSEDE